VKYALFWSGGKDSLLALDRARRFGLRVEALVNLYEGNTGRVRFHGVRKGLIGAQAAALGIELLQGHTHPHSFEEAFLLQLQQLKEKGFGGLVFGNIHLTDIRAWYEERTKALGFEHIEPLWGCSPSSLLREFVERGHRARIVSVFLDAGGRKDWLGREFSQEFAGELERTENIDVCGERGEYHSFAFGGPLFRAPLELTALREFEMEHHLILDVELGAPALVQAQRSAQI
jgi:diphthine-ammonia ligase